MNMKNGNFWDRNRNNNYKYNNNNIVHKKMIEKVFGEVNNSISENKAVTIMDGYEAIETPNVFDINAEFATRHQSVVSLKDMLDRIHVPMDELVNKQIQEIDHDQDIHRLKLFMQQNINPFDIARKERGLQMHRTTKVMSEWDSAIDTREEQLKNERNRAFIAPSATMTSFLDNMQWGGGLGKELQHILNDYQTKHDLLTVTMPEIEIQGTEEVDKEKEEEEEVGNGEEEKQKEEKETEETEQDQSQTTTHTNKKVMINKIKKSPTDLTIKKTLTSKLTPSRTELIASRKKMAQMRRQISHQMKEFQRIKRIKSRAFRRRLRRRKMAVQPSLEELREMDPQLFRREMRKMLQAYAEERITLKHANNNQWAQWILRQSKVEKNNKKQEWFWQ